MKNTVRTRRNGIRFFGMRTSVPKDSSAFERMFFWNECEHLHTEIFTLIWTGVEIGVTTCIYSFKHAEKHTDLSEQGYCDGRICPLNYSFFFFFFGDNVFPSQKTNFFFGDWQFCSKKNRCKKKRRDFSDCLNFHPKKIKLAIFFGTKFKIPPQSVLLGSDFLVS